MKRKRNLKKRAIKKNQYPKLGQQYTISPDPSGKCHICKKKELVEGYKNSRPNKKIEVQYTSFRGDDEVYFFHAECLIDVPKENLLENILDTAQES